MAVKAEKSGAEVRAMVVLQLEQEQLVRTFLSKVDMAQIPALCEGMEEGGPSLEQIEFVVHYAKVVYSESPEDFFSIFKHQPQYKTDMHILSLLSISLMRLHVTKAIDDYLDVRGAVSVH